MSILSSHAIRTRLNLDRLEELADEEIPFVSTEDVEEAFKATSKTLSETESIINELHQVSERLIRNRGLTQDDLVCVERVAGESLVSSSVRNALTSQPSETYYHEIRVATEALSERLKLGIIIAIISVIIKIFNWILNFSRERKVNEYREFVAKIPELVETSDEFKSKARAACGGNDYMYEEFWNRYPEFGKGKSTPEQYANVLINYAEITSFLVGYVFIKDEGQKEDCLFEVVYRERGIHLGKMIVDEFDRVHGLQNTPLAEKGQLKRVIFAVLLKTGCLATCFNGDDENVKRFVDLWYNGFLGDAINSTFFRTGWRVFTHRAFDYFKSSEHANHLSKAEYQIDVTIKALSNFKRDHSAGRKYPFPDEVGNAPVDTYFRDVSTPAEYRYRLPTLQEAPLLWGPAYVSHDLGYAAFGSNITTDKTNNRMWFNQFVTSAVFAPLSLFTTEAANSLVLSTVSAAGAGGWKYPTVSFKDKIPPDFFSVIENYHDVYPVGGYLTQEDEHKPITVYDVAPKYRPQPSLDYYQTPCLYVPKVTSLPLKNYDPEIVYKLDNRTFNSLMPAFMMLMTGSASSLVDLKDFDPGRYRRRYETLRKKTSKILDEMRELEKLASRGKETLQATFREHYTIDNARWDDAINVVWWAWETNNLDVIKPEKDYNNVKNWNSKKNMADEASESLRADNAWFALKDTLEAIKILGVVSGRAKDIATVLQSSPLAGLKWYVNPNHGYFK